MDQQKFVELLQSTQISDTQRVRAATAELKKNYYTRPEGLLGLLHILVSNPEPTLRQLSAVQSMRLVPKLWSKIDAQQKVAVRNELVEAVLREQDSKVRHALSRVIARVAAIDFEAGEWADLLPKVWQLTTGPNVAHREVGSYVVYALLEADPTHFVSELQRLFDLFANTIKDPESRQVRLNTLLSISNVLMLIDADDDETALAKIQEFIPAMVDVLKDSIDSGDEDNTRQIFEVFQSFLGYESALLSKYFRDLVQFMLDLAANTNADEDVRSQALAFLTQCVRYRRMKIQGTPDMGAQLTRKAMLILSELEDDDEEDDITPARAALELIDQLSTDLPPRQVVVPLLDDFPKYATSDRPGFRRAGMMALGVCAEGAPDFVSTQIESLMPTIIQLLNDPNRNVRHDALIGLMRMGEDLGETIKSNHEPIMKALVNNLEEASKNASEPKNIEIIRSVCGSIETLAEGFGPEVMTNYVQGLITRIGALLNHPDVKVKGASAGAIGAVALSVEGAFKPYLKDTMEVMAPYVQVDSGEDELQLRSSVCDAMGRIAVAVGAQEFQPFVMPLLAASEQALNLGNARLRETTFILWSQLARVYSGDLGDALQGIFKGLFDSLELEEEDMEDGLPEELEGLIDGGLVSDGKKIKVSPAEIEDEDEMDDDDDDDDDWDDVIGVSAAALEKEVAIEVLGDVISHAKTRSVPFLTQAVELVAPLAEHTYEGCRKASLSTLWRMYACVWEMMEQHTGTKWQPGLPLKTPPTDNVVKLGEVVANATLQLWQDDTDRDVVTEINRNVAAALKTCGPAILAHKDMTEQTITCIGTIITRAHPCQQDMGDEDEDAAGGGADAGGGSEWDWLVIDTALDVVIGLAAALGAQFAEVWKVFEKPVMKLASSPEAIERSTAVGVVAECTAYMGGAVTPYTASLLPALLHRLSDEDKETKSNAAYAIGQLVYHSDDAATYLPAFEQIMTKLEPLLGVSESRLQDNATGCLARLILAHPDRVPLAEVLPVMVGLLPLKQDYEENKPVYECIAKLCTAQEPTMLSLTQKLVPVFQQVLGPPEDQLEPETRQLVQGLVAQMGLA